MIVCIEDAPKFNENSNNEIINFVDEYLQCSIDDQDIGHLADLLMCFQVLSDPRFSFFKPL